MRLPTYRELRRFVECEGWTDRDQAGGRKTGDHHRYVFTTPTGERLYTRISHGRGRYGDADLFQHVLRDQLHVTEGQFWDAVDHGVKPDRPVPRAVPDAPAMDAKLARNLLTKARLSPADLVGMTQEQAVVRWNQWLTEGR